MITLNDVDNNTEETTKTTTTTNNNEETTTTTAASSSSEEEQKEQQFSTSSEPIFHTIGLNDSAPLELESFCVNCERNGTTRMLFTRIPHFREVIISSFSCQHCGFRNQEIQFGGSYGDFGVGYTLKVEKKEDLDRQIVKSDFATLSIPEIDFEIPENTQKGTLTTVEGVINRAIENLLDGQATRRVLDPALASAIDSFVEKAQKLISGEGFPFTVVLDDYSGNSNVEKLIIPHDPQVFTRYYQRSVEQTEKLGLSLGAQNYTEAAAALGEEKPHSRLTANLPASIISNEREIELLQEKMSAPEEVFTFNEPCYGCGVVGNLKMMPLIVPFFKDIILMSFTCDKCGYKTTEVRAGGKISSHATKLTLRVTNPEDLSRDVLKSETASLDIPELDLHVATGSLGGKFTTVEGLLMNIKDKLTEVNQFRVGDSAEETESFQNFLKGIEEMQTGGRLPWTLIIDDPVSNSYIQNLFAPDDDPFLTVEQYERTFEQNEDLGLNDIKTEEY